MSTILRRTTCGISTYELVVTSPATTTSPVVTRHSTATRLCGSSAISSSSTESLIWSAILSGCPSVTDSDVKYLRVIVVLTWLTLTPLPRAPNLPTRSLCQGGVPNVMRERVLAPGQRPADAIGRHQCYLAVRLTEDPARADLVEDEQIAALPLQFCPAQIDQTVLGIRCFRGKAHQQLPLIGACGCQAGEDVGALHQLELQARIVGLLDLGSARPRRGEVGGCRSHHHHVSILSGH